MTHVWLPQEAADGYEVRRCRHCIAQPWQLWRNRRIERFGQTRGELFRKVKR
jgi:hypothetical protein